MLDDLPIDTPDKERVLMVVNAYLINKGVKFVGDVPEPIKQAGLELAHAFMNGELLAGRTEGVVTSKSSKAGGCVCFKKPMPMGRTVRQWVSMR